METARHHHDHTAGLEAFLDLVNSLEYTDGIPEEHLPTVQDAIEYFARRDLGHRESLEAVAVDREGEKRLARLRTVRAAAREVWDAVVEHRAADPQAIEQVNVALQHRPLVELTLGRDGCSVGHRHTGDPWDEATARTLEPFVEAVSRGETDRFRICADDSCRYVFEDESKAGRRRWCSMETCGNRAKAARHRARKKAETASVA